MNIKKNRDEVHKMELYQCSKADYTDYIKFVKRIYNSYPNYKDSSTPVLKQFLYKRGVFCSSLDIVPVMVKDDNSIYAVCMYISSKNYENTLQIAFFEALENCQEAVDLIMEKAFQLCRQRGFSKIAIGLNGHVNYSIGFLCDRVDEEISFGSSFTPPYYAAYFRKYEPKQFDMVSYCGDMSTMNFTKYEKLLQRINKRFNYRHMDFKSFRGEMKIYTDLNNICFKEHPFYFERSYEEDYELFRELKYFIKGENVIFVQEGDKPVGYMLWYPDFNELLGYGKTIGIGTCISNRLFPKRIRKLKIVEIAVLPEYQNSGAILGLFHECHKENAGRFAAYETSWILEENYKSRNLGAKLLEKEYKHYTAYELCLQEML
jgi:hypothetical protein